MEGCGPSHPWAARACRPPIATFQTGSKGWPICNIPINEIKIPAGQNVFAQSPLADVRSSSNNNTYMLSSGGDTNTREPGLGEDFLRCVEACMLTVQRHP